MWRAGAGDSCRIGLRSGVEVEELKGALYFAVDGAGGDDADAFEKEAWGELRLEGGKCETGLCGRHCDRNWACLVGGFHVSDMMGCSSRGTVLHVDTTEDAFVYITDQMLSV